MKSIPFFDGKIKINVHTATRKDDVGRVMTIEEFAQGNPVSLHETEDGELFVCVRNSKGLPGPDRFIEGPEMSEPSPYDLFMLQQERIDDELDRNPKS